VCLNRAQQTATNWLNSGQQYAKDHWNHSIHLVMTVNWKLFDKLFSHHNLQLLHEVRTQATAYRIIFANKRTQLTTGAEEAYRVGNLTPRIVWNIGSICLMLSLKTASGVLHEQQLWFPSETPRCSGRL